MLVAANQSFARQFPTLMEKPKDIIDLERPDLDLPPVIEPKSNIIDNIKKKYESQLKDWQEKLAKFNERAPKPEAKTIEIVPVKEEEKKTEDTVSYVIKDAIEIKTAEVDSEKKRPEEIITQYNEPEENTGRIIPNFTEVVEPQSKKGLGLLNKVFVKKNKPVKLEPAPKINPAESKEKLDTFHKENGMFQDASEEDLKQERDEINKQTFLNSVPVTDNDSKNHLPITASRRKYFQDYVDDVLRGTVTAEQLPEDIAHTVALILSEHPDPAIIPDKKSTYVQNEEQKDSNGWSKILEVKEPEKNEIILPNIEPTPAEDIHDIAESITVEAKIPQEKITKHKIKMLSNDEYRRRIEDRINSLITKIEQGEIKLADLSQEDQQVIIGLMNSNE
jgi:hypothetical protein